MAQKALLSWYGNYGRHSLPWRNTDDVYHVYISEVMLQQTQVSRVQEHFYPSFLEKFPTVDDLANANIDDVLTAWSGLGYYSRARNLHKAAIECSKLKTIPDTLKELESLPGIGKYTASAICSFALHQKVSVVDTNIKRVLRRYFAIIENSESIVYDFANSFLNDKSPRDHNLALMDLGSMICTATNPQCDSCPLSQTCQGKENPLQYTQTKKIKYEDLELFLAIVIKENQIGLVKSKEKLYKDMLTLPHTDPIDEDFIGSFKHSYTKYKITVNLYQSDLIPEDVKWVELEDMENLPISSLTKKAFKKLSKNL